jgi:hypothetical protein
VTTTIYQTPLFSTTTLVIHGSQLVTMFHLATTLCENGKITRMLITPIDKSKTSNNILGCSQNQPTTYCGGATLAWTATSKFQELLT